ncbi:MAG: fasciclin domain-containing protein [Halanaeroarchaeum sp.]
MSPNRRDALKTLGTGIAVLAGGTGTALARGPEGRGRKGASAEKGIVATADELGFSTLITAVKAADPVVLQTLTNDDQYTVFAPTNGAFENFFATVEAATDLTPADLLQDKKGLLTKTLLFHVTGGRRYAASVVNAPEVDTLLGEPVTVDDGTLDGRAAIQTTNVEASNGVIHAIDAVLTPPAVDDLL